MALDIKDSNKQWSFIKTYHESAYEQLPIDPDRARYAMVALRQPMAGNWCAFRPKSLLFGDEASAIHYNCFSRTIAFLVNRIFGKPLVSYFDDMGAPTPTEIDQLAIETVSIFTRTLRVFPKKRTKQD